MRTMRAHDRPSTSRAFTLVELMVVLAIITILLSIGAAAYMRSIPEGQKRAAAEHLRAIAAAIQVYHAQYHDYPPMRFHEVIPYANVTPGAPPWPNHGAAAQASPDMLQSIEACLYSLEYRSSAGPALSRLPAKVLTTAGTDSVTDGPAGTRPLSVALDPWGNPVQYLRPIAGVSVDHPLSAARLNNRVLLISMGPDGKPGAAEVNDENVGAPVPDVWQDNRQYGAGVANEWFPDPTELGRGDDVVVQVGSIQ